MTAPHIASIAVTPVMASDRTCELVFGVNWRTLRPFLQQQGVSVHKIGRRAVVLVADVVAALEKDEGGDPKPWNEEEIIAQAAGKGPAKSSDGCSAVFDPDAPWLAAAMETIRAQQSLDRRAEEWLSSRGIGKSDQISDPELRRRVRGIESRDRRRAKIDADRASKGLPARRWR